MDYEIEPDWIDLTHSILLFKIIVKNKVFHNYLNYKYRSYACW